MDNRRILKIKKRSSPCWMVIYILALPLFWGTLFDLLSLPSVLKYTADVAWVGLLGFMAFKRNITIPGRVYPLVILATVFFLYSLFLYLLNYQSIIYFLWGMRNNFRYYVYFFAIILYFGWDDAENSFKIFDILFWINFPVTLFQYFVLGYKQDFLGGIFGVQIGANAFTIIFFSIVLSRSLMKYMEQKERFILCASKCTVALFIAALAELKFFFVFFVVILVMSTVFTSFSWRKFVIFIVCATLVYLTSILLETLFEFEDFMSIEYIWESATREHYSSDKTVNRLSAIPTLAEKLVPDFEDRLFGLGLGNCDTSSFEICNTPFYQAYGHLRYMFFSAAFLFLEVGYIGLLLYVAFFVMCFILIRKRINLGVCDKLHGRVALILAVLSVILVVYNSSLRAEAGYMVFFVLALPFIPYDTESNNLAIQPVNTLVK